MFFGSVLNSPHHPVANPFTRRAVRRHFAKELSSNPSTDDLYPSSDKRIHPKKKMAKIKAEPSASPQASAALGLDKVETGIVAHPATDDGSIGEQDDSSLTEKFNKLFGERGNALTNAASWMEQATALFNKLVTKRDQAAKGPEEWEEKLAEIEHRLSDFENWYSDSVHFAEDWEAIAKDWETKALASEQEVAKLKLKIKRDQAILKACLDGLGEE